MEMDSVIPQVGGLNKIVTLKTRHTLSLYTHYSLYTYKMALNTYAYRPTSFGQADRQWR